MANAKEIGTKLVGFCKEGRNVDAINELYADDAVSVEAMTPPGGQREAAGRTAILGKNTWWAENHEVHAANVAGPFPHGDDRFAVHFDYDVTFTPEKKRMQMTEVGLYTVANGKVVREEFFYDM